jgi:hypothetical protein
MSSSVSYQLDDFQTSGRRKTESQRKVLMQWGEEEIEENNAYVGASVRNLIASKPGLTDEEKIMTQRLAMKAFHFPNHTYWQDWYMFLTNNHIWLGFCFAHHLHPFGRRERILNLVASLAFGLAATSGLYLWYFNHEEQEDIAYISVFGMFNVTQGLVASAFFGGFCNTIFDFGIWILQVCPPCQPGSPWADKLSDHTKFFWLWMGSNVAYFMTFVAICLAISVCLVRASVIADGSEEGYSDSINDYSFMGSFVLEVVVTQFIMFPIVAGLIFSGVLGCFVVPFFGGRPYQKKKMDRLLRKQRMKESGPCEV